MVIDAALARHPWAKNVLRNLTYQRTNLKLTEIIEGGSMRKHIGLFAALAICSLSLSAQNLKVAVMDFELSSDNPQFKYLGKGFTELTSVEIAQLPGFTLVDRERRNAILEEQAFALSGAADESGAMEIGKLLSVDYFVTGSIVDMLGSLVVTYQVVRTDTGAVVGKQTAEGAPNEYKKIVKEIGRGIAKMAGKTAAVAAVAQAAPPTPKAKQADVLTNFSEAVAALDNKDLKTAAAKLETARKLDPTDPAVRYYLDKLNSGTSKFAVIPEAYFSLDNPASIALRNSDTLYIYSALGGTSFIGSPWPGINTTILPNAVALPGLYGSDVGGDSPYATTYGLRNLDSRTFVGYSVPVAKGFGVGAQAFFSHVESNVQRKENTGPAGTGKLYSTAWDSMSFYVGELLLSWAPSDRLSIGIGGTAGVYNGNVSDWRGTQRNEKTDPPSPLYGGELGLMAKSPGGGFMFSFSMGLSSYLPYEFDKNEATIVTPQDLSVNACSDLSGTWGFNGMRDFLVLKFISDFYGFHNAPPPFMQLLPAYEHWFGKAFSLRAGGAVSMSPTEAINIGLGGSLGATLVMGSWSLDLGATYRDKPAEVLKSAVVPDFVLSIGVRKSGLAKRD
jgi:TolB-like protein